MFKKTWFKRNLSATSKIEHSNFKSESLFIEKYKGLRLFSSLHFKIKIIFLFRIWLFRSFSKSITNSTRSNSSKLRVKSWLSILAASKILSVRNLIFLAFFIIILTKSFI